MQVRVRWGSSRERDPDGIVAQDVHKEIRHRDRSGVPLRLSLEAPQRVPKPGSVFKLAGIGHLQLGGPSEDVSVRRASRQATLAEAAWNRRLNASGSRSASLAPEHTKGHLVLAPFRAPLALS
jgi:hypothetical protein